MAWRDVPKLTRPSPPDVPEGAVFGVRVLASGSSGNCTVLMVPGDDPRQPRRLSLIDAGISPGRVRAALAEDGLEFGRLDDIFVTHLDQDHFHPGWRRPKHCRATLRLHQRHVPRAERIGALYRRTEPFLDRLEPHESLTAEATIMSHDDFGVAAFRFTVRTAAGASTLGFATDLGRVTKPLIDMMSRVDVLAIESNYCPVMQADSDRPAFLKDRITGGAGHLSNEECHRAVLAAAPRQHVVLLHLSRQCNTPDRVAGMHAETGLPTTITSQTEPTGWIWAMPGAAAVETRAWRQPSLFQPVEGSA